MNNNVPMKNQETSLAVATASKVNSMLKSNKAAIMATLPHGFNYDRMCRSVINAVSTTPELAKSTPASIFLSTVRAFSLGIEPNGALAEGYLVPFWNSKKQSNEAQFMLGYRGLISLARRSGKIANIYAQAVYSEDVFEVELGTERKIVHKPNFLKTRGQAVCYYAVFQGTDGYSDFEVMTMEEIEKVRLSSKSGGSGAWKMWANEMAKKTVLRRLLKRAPMSIELAEEVNRDNKIAVGEDVTDVINIEGLEVDESTSADVQEAINADRLEAVKERINAASDSLV